MTGSIPDNRLSFSKIKTVMRCPEWFRLQYVIKVRGMVGPQLILGSNWHRGQEHGIKQMIEKAVPKTGEVVEVAVEQLRMDLKSQTVLDFNEFDSSAKTMEPDLIKMVKYGFEQIAKTFRPTRSERDFVFQLDAETTVQGRTDVEEEYENKDEGITEMKTTTRVPGDLAIFDWQTTIYQNSKPNIKRLKKFYVVRQKNANRDVKIVQFKKAADSPEYVADVLQSMKYIKESIKNYSIHGYPKTSDLQTCSWCPYRFGCKPEIFEYEGKVEKLITKELLFSTNPNDTTGEIKNEKGKEGQQGEGESIGNSAGIVVTEKGIFVDDGRLPRVIVEGQGGRRGGERNPNAHKKSGKFPAGF